MQSESLRGPSQRSRMETLRIAMNYERFWLMLCFLNENAAAIQAIAAALGTLLSIVTIIFVIRATLAANQQAAAAKQQVEAALAATAVAEQQRLAAEDAAAAARRQNQLAEEAAEQAKWPMLVLVRVAEPGQSAMMYIENQGTGVAVDVSWYQSHELWPLTAKDRHVPYQTILGPGYKTRIQMNYELPLRQKLTLDCRTVDGVPAQTKVEPFADTYTQSPLRFANNASPQRFQAPW